MQFNLVPPPAVHKIGNVYRAGETEDTYMLVQVGVQRVALVQLTGRVVDDASIGNRWRDGRSVGSALNITQDEFDGIGGDRLDLRFVGRLEIV